MNDTSAIWDSVKAWFNHALMKGEQWFAAAQLWLEGRENPEYWLGGGAAGVSLLLLLLILSGRSRKKRRLAETQAEADRKAQRIRAEKVSELKQIGAAGNEARMQGDYPTAEARYKKCLALAEDIDRKEGIAGAKCGLGILALAQGQFDDAEALLKEALTIDETLGRQDGIGTALANLGFLAAERGQMNSAFEYLDRAEAAYIKVVLFGKQLRTGTADGLQVSLTFYTALDIG
ncbi:MAG: tetratricopeptide repeat protein, partial [Pseudomonadota bacterium]